ncbi:DUF6191 domain-containing protein [Streptomyces sp. NRRL F-5135]|uniref:DUF6191 domain-containing protein n=1 Tax=Streptomyces sp. NRRL F-5135 TaxID=1463858 RepID=UPI0004C80CA9|nr:DUF6191 domain-containing protein [Streptomyces sp. NRRL F-5135]
MFNMFEELFSPGRKHTHDERKRLELSRYDVSDNDPGRGPIDLASGKVTIRVPEEPTEPAEPAEPAQNSGGRAEESGGCGRAAEPGEDVGRPRED